MRPANFAERVASINDINFQTTDKKETLLHIVASRKDPLGVKIAKSIMAKGAYTMLEDADGSLPVHHAIEADDKEMLVAILERNLNMISLNHSKTGYSLAHLAAEKFSWKCLEFLLERSPALADGSLPKSGCAPIHLSLYVILDPNNGLKLADKKVEIVLSNLLAKTSMTTLLKQDHGSDGDSVLHMLVKINYAVGIQTLLTRFKEDTMLNKLVNSQATKTKKTPLVAAFTEDNIIDFSIARLLLDHKADPKVKWKQKVTTELAIDNSRVNLEEKYKIIKILLSKV